jgi:hypothetical protein
VPKLTTSSAIAVIGAADFVLPHVDALPVGVEAVPVKRENVVDDDLPSGASEAREHLPRLLVRPRAEPVHDHADLHALREFPLQQRCHPQPDLALTPTEHQDVHRRARGFDIGEDLREEVHALRPRLDRRRGRPGERKRSVVWPCAGSRCKRLRRSLSTRRRDRVDGWRPTGPLCDPEHAPVRDDEDQGERAQCDCKDVPQQAQRCGANGRSSS